MRSVCALALAAICCLTYVQLSFFLLDQRQPTSRVGHYSPALPATTSNSAQLVAAATSRAGRSEQREESGGVTPQPTVIQTPTPPLPVIQTPAPTRQPLPTAAEPTRAVSSGAKRAPVEEPKRPVLDRALVTARAASPAAAVAQPAPSTSYVSIGCIFKGENAFLVEWIEYHRLIGVGHFFMVSNDCGEAAAASAALLAPFVSAGLVTLYADYQCSPRGFQNDAYTLLLRKSAGLAFWLMIVDIDEFIVVEDDSASVVDAMRLYEREQYDAVALMWRLFGTSGHRQVPEGAVLFNYRFRALSEAKDSRARSFKSIVRPERCAQMATHMCAAFNCQLDARAALVGRRDHCGCTASTDLGHCMTEQYLHLREGRPKFTRLWMNHYRTKSVEDWERKKARGRASVAEDARNSKRTGPPPEEYNRARDDSLPSSVQARLTRLAERDPRESERLRRLLLSGAGSRIDGGGHADEGGSRGAKSRRSRSRRSQRRDAG